MNEGYTTFGVVIFKMETKEIEDKLDQIISLLEKIESNSGSYT